MLLSALLACGSALAQTATGTNAAAAQRALKIVLIPGDQATLASINAVKQLKTERAYGRVTFRVLPQSLLNAADLQALSQADIVFARHMVGMNSAPVVAAMQAVATRRGKIYGIGQNDGVSSQLGMTEDVALRRYADAGGVENLVHMVRFALHRDHGFATAAAPARELPQAAMWEPRSGRLFENFDDYAATYFAQRPKAKELPWVGMVINRGQATGGSEENIQAIAQALEKRGFNVLPAYGFPSTVPVERFFTDATGRARVVAVVALGMKLGNVPDKIGPALEKLDVPLVNGIVLYKSTREAWEASPLGLDHAERAWQVGGPEFAGIIAPTVVASKERRTDAVTGLEYVAEVPIPERIARLTDRVRKLVDLRMQPERDKRIALIYYNYPAGRENVGASYLNVMARSLWQILARLESEGYATQGRPAHEEALFDRLRNHGTNIADTTPGALQALVASGQAVLWPVTEYRRWFDAQPAPLRASMVKSWGEPEAAQTMVWRDRSGKPFFVFPAQRYGNVLFAPQPARGWGDVKKMYHDVTLAPHHQYLAFYLWLQKDFKASAMVHVGTHGTHEWLPGKEVGFTAADPSEAMVGDVPQVYPYSVDVVGEGLQAKRRGMATLVSHMTPPFDKAGLNPDLVVLHGLFDDHNVASQQSVSATAANLAALNAQARKMGLLKDIGKTELRDSDDINALHDHLHEIEAQQTPLGLHTFGVAPDAARRQSTADAMVERMADVPDEEAGIKAHSINELLLQSARAELDALVAALDGRYVGAGVGGDPLRSPASLPTGRNFYGFDPSRLPTSGVYEQGATLATNMLTDYRRRHGGSMPPRLMFNLWSGETMRHGGLLESQILALLGVRPTWDSFGRVSGVEVIPREKLGRARVDVVITPSGLYRDSLPTLMLLLDKAVSAVKDLPEADNPIRAFVQRTRLALEARGVDTVQAERLAAMRLFTDPPGAYGTGLDNVIRASNTWSAEEQVAEVYFNRMGHLFGQGYWGERSEGNVPAVDIFKMALKDVKAVLHSRTSNLYGTLDNDDVFQFLGGAAMAVRQVNGSTPETLMVNLAEPGRERVETLDRFMGREMRARYLNPLWTDSMLKEGYAGARLIQQTVDNLWGWQVTVPEAVDAAKWQAMFETYVQDKHQLNIRQRFRDAKNTLAYQALVDRMLVAVNKGYWAAEPEVIAQLEAANRQAIAEAGVACDRTSCSSAEVTRLAEDIDKALAAQARGGYGLSGATPPGAAQPAAAAAAPSPLNSEPPPVATPTPTAAKDPVVRGQELREQLPRAVPVQQLAWAYGALILLVLAGGAAWQAWRTARERRNSPNPSSSIPTGVPT